MPEMADGSTWQLRVHMLQLCAAGARTGQPAFLTDHERECTFYFLNDSCTYVRLAATALVPIFARCVYFPITFVEDNSVATWVNRL